MATADALLKPDHATRRKHFIFTEEHDQLRESIRAFVTKELAPHAEEWEETTFPDSVFRRMGELGFLGLSYPEEYGGQGGDYYCNLVLAEEMTHCNSRRAGDGRGGAHRHGHPAGVPVRHRGAEAGVPRAGDPGEKISCLGITEPDAGSDVAGIKTRAVRDGDECVINGSKTYITNGHRADFIVLVTKTDPDAGYDGFTLFLVDMDAPGVIREKKLEKLGMHASDTALLAFQDVRVPAERDAGPGGQGLLPHHVGAPGRAADRRGGLRRGRAARASTRRSSTRTERNAFGRAIGSFQAIRHKFADMATKIEAGRQMVYTTAWRFQNGEYPVREISMAKLYAARMACEVTDECLQIHGGAGYMKEYGIERAWRDMRLNRIGAGTDEVMLDVIGRSYGL